MAASSLIFQKKRGRDEYLNSGFAPPDAKRTNSGTILGYDSNFMALLDRIDSVDNNNSNPEYTHTVVDNVEGEMRLNVVNNSVENEIGFTDEESSTEEMGSNKQGELTDKNMKSTDDESSTEEMGSNKQGELTDKNMKYTDEESSTEEMGSNKQGELTAEGDSEAISVTFDMGDFPYYDDVFETFDMGFLLHNFTPDELGILKNHIYGDSDPDSVYLDAVHGYVETTEVFYGSLWEDDIWH